MAELCVGVRGVDGGSVLEKVSRAVRSLHDGTVRSEATEEGGGGEYRTRTNECHVHARTHTHCGKTHIEGTLKLQFAVTENKSP